MELEELQAAEAVKEAEIEGIKEVMEAKEKMAEE